MKARGTADVTRIHKGTQRVGDVEIETSIAVETTECAKLVAVSKDSQTIGTFLDWLRSGRVPRVTLCVMDDSSERYRPSYTSIEKLLAEYFEIDLNKVEEERRAILEGIRR